EDSGKDGGERSAPSFEDSGKDGGERSAPLFEDTGTSISKRRGKRSAPSFNIKDLKRIEKEVVIFKPVRVLG
ncbi:hypothetical protein L6386_03380, partial [bacterium]|nr:hypothetical protein [bacterium]